MKILGFPPASMTPQALSAIQIEFAKSGIAVFWSQTKELVVMAVHADMTVEEIMGTTSGFPWVLKNVLTRVIT